jgi:hypothetical protein
MMETKPLLMSVKSLQKHTDPFLLLKIDKNAIIKCKTLKEFVVEEDRTQSYHKGRIQYFIKKLKNKERVDPIYVREKFDTDKEQCILLICNGLHRFAAHIILNKKFVNVIEEGPRQYL